MYYQKVAGLLQSPKSRTTGSKELYLVRKATHAIDSGSIKIQLKAWRTSNLVNTNDLTNWSSVSVMRGRGYRSFFVRVFSQQQSIQKRKLLSFFLTNKTSDKQEELDVLIKPFFRFSTKYSLIFSSSQLLILQRQAVFIKGSSPSKRSLWSNGRDSSRVSTAFFENASAMSCSQASREARKSLSSLASKGVVSPKASSSSLSRVYTTSLVRAQHPASCSPLSRQSTVIRACRFATFRGFRPRFSQIQSISSIVTDLTQQLIPLILV